MGIAPPANRDPPANGMPPGAKVASPRWPAGNGAATVSLICAALWPICLLAPAVVMGIQGSPILPNWVGTLTGFGLVTTPVVGIISGGVGLYRSIRTPELRAGRWRAIVGLVLGGIWLAGTLLL